MAARATTAAQIMSAYDPEGRGDAFIQECAERGADLLPMRERDVYQYTFPDQSSLVARGGNVSSGYAKVEFLDLDLRSRLSATLPTLARLGEA
jgi:hypothetical protein